MVEFQVMDKETLRQRLLTQRASLMPTQVAYASENVCRHLAAWPIFQQATSVLAYMAFRNEVSLQPLMDQYPDKVWALPRTLAGGRLSVCRYERSRMVSHPFGMQEPSADAPSVPPSPIATPWTARASVMWWSTGKMADFSLEAPVRRHSPRPSRKP